MGMITEQLQKTPQIAGTTPSRTVAEYVSREDVRAQLMPVLGEAGLQRFSTAIIAAVQNTPALAVCTPRSIINAALLGESLGLSPAPQMGQYYMVPYKRNLKNKATGQWQEVSEAQFQMGYKGYVQLALRSGMYRKINVATIKEGELVSYDPLNEEISVNLIEDDVKRENTPAMGYFAMIELTNGFRKILYWGKDKMLRHADRYSKAFSAKAVTGKYPKVSYEDYVAGNYDKNDEWKYSSFWYKDFELMAHKTMIRQIISKNGIMSVDFQTAYENDMAVVGDNGSKEYVDSPDALFDEADAIDVDFEEVTDD